MAKTSPRTRANSLAATAVIGLLVLGGCAPIEHQAGNLPQEPQLSKLTPGVSSKEDVVRALGTPSTTGTFAADKWYYVSQYSEAVAFFEPELLDQRVVVISFNGDGVVEDIDHLDRDNGQFVQMVERKTPTAGHSLTAIEQILGNIGRVGN